MAIAQIIIESEKKSKLYTEISHSKVEPEVLNGTWLGQLGLRLTEGVRKEEVNKIFDNLTFIIFNYDRCVEEGFVHILCNYYLMEREKAQEIVNRLSVYHPYGTVGSLRWQNGTANKIGFGESVFGTSLPDISKGIKTFTEQVGEPDYLDKIKEAYRKADRIIFAFHDLNMQLLSPVSTNRNNQMSGPKTYGTVYGMSQSEIRVVQNVLKQSFGKSIMPRDADLVSRTCIEMVREYGREICSG